MEIYPQPKAPTAVDDYTFDWTKWLVEGETLAGVDVTMVDANGASQPYPATVSGNISRVWFSGGNAGGRIVYMLTVTTTATPPRLLPEAFGVEVIDPATVVTDAQGIAADIAQLEIARTNLAAGRRIDEVWRDGRRLTYGKVTLDGLTALIAQRRRDLAVAKADEAGAPRRRAIGLSWKN